MEVQCYLCGCPFERAVDMAGSVAGHRIGQKNRYIIYLPTTNHSNDQVLRERQLSPAAMVLRRGFRMATCRREFNHYPRYGVLLPELGLGNWKMADHCESCRDSKAASEIRQRWLVTRFSFLLSSYLFVFSLIIL